MLNLMEEFLTVDEVARRMRVSRSTIFNLIDKGEIPATRIGRQIRISKFDFQAYLERNATGKREQEDE